MQEISTPARFVGWLFLAMIILAAGFGLGRLSHAGQTEPTDTQKPAQWETNWPQLKQGMTKEDVLNLVGAPSSTNVQEMNITNVDMHPPNPNTERYLEQTTAKLNQKFSGAIWSYYGTIVIHTTPGEDNQAAFAQTGKQVVGVLNLNGFFGKMQGHAIKFDGSGRVVEISAK